MMVQSFPAVDSVSFVRRAKHCLAAAVVATSVIAVSPAAFAQDNNQQLQHQIQLLRRELTDIQKVVFKGVAPASVAPSATSATGGDVPASIAGRLQVKMQELDEQLRDLNGRYEEMDNRIRRVETRLDKLVEDIDFRLRALEDGGVAAGNAGQQQQTTPQVSSNTSTAATGGDGTETTIISSQGAQGPAAPHTLGTLSQSDLQAVQPGTQTASANPTPAAVANTPKGQYDQAMSLLHQHDFDGAEKALRGFLDQYPEDKLVGNAKYWLGETYYARQKYAEAARVFSDAYMKDKQGTKATHSLLKLAMSLEQIGQTDASCVAYQELISKHGDAEPRILDRARSARKKLKCQ
ncbi:tol-pal system protein YbgF [Aestuariispira ectoiniformans]|uniref:tol-pal system protein YbgF n=1 Tax=Aestuariispira ectoiniformans TaxID=2775080 RepID=UPI00223BAB2C|nr:tol-pal system protein YbgF [Aestuariispira ectoiniformans]